jgi:hypothetical protein
MVAGEIENDEDIGNIGAKTFCNGRAPNGAPISENETARAQTMDVQVRAALPMRERSRCKPAFPFLQIQTLD